MVSVDVMIWQEKTEFNFRISNCMPLHALLSPVCVGPKSHIFTWIGLVESRDDLMCSLYANTQSMPIIILYKQHSYSRISFRSNREDLVFILFAITSCA